MHQIDNSTAATTQPPIEAVGPNPNGFFRPQNTELGQDATILSHTWLNAMMMEICNVVTGAGITLDKTVQNQLFTAIQTLISNAVDNNNPAVLKAITQNGHGFTAGQVLYFNGSNWIKAQANALSTSQTVGMIYSVESTNVFTLILVGYVTNLELTLTPGSQYYLSTTTPGAITANRPNSDGTIIKPLLIADSPTSGYFFNQEAIPYSSSLTGVMLGANNLSDVVDVATSRTNLGLGSAALNNTGDFIATIDAGNFLATDNNLSDLMNPGVARTNLGLGTAATTDATTYAAATDLATAQGDITTLQGDLANYQPLDATLSALAGTITAANKLIYASGVDTFATADLTAFGRSLMADANAAAAQTTLGLGSAATHAATDFASSTHTHVLADITDVTATSTQVNYLVGVTSAIQTQLNNKQGLDATLTALAGVTTAADRLIYATGSDAFATTDFTAFARTFLDDTNQAAVQATLGLVPGTNVQAHSTILDNTTASYTTALDTKLGGIAAGADVTATYLSGGLTGATVATDDKVLIQDTSASNSLKTVSVQSIVDLAGASATPDTVVRLAGGTVTNISQLIIINLTATYIKYLIVCADIVSAASQATLYMTTSTDNGASFNTSSTDYVYRTAISSSADAAHPLSASATIAANYLIRDIGNAANCFQSGNIEIFNPMDGFTRTIIKTRCGGLDYNGNPILQDNMAQRNAAEINNAVRIFSNNGGSDLGFSMRYAIYGYVA